ncbi:hypothetical protein AVEN_149534-1 [Araneus ventricosus]|uniref:Uncharacterized protein n=1 Tax=Araneus ventricosus TaxID=182803 RepID=A0A4Y2P8G7_ARAVE|nr:hypothetical protein AVEN_149534-1 [Araneus ventricosus]
MLDSVLVKNGGSPFLRGVYSGICQEDYHLSLFSGLFFKLSVGPLACCRKNITPLSVNLQRSFEASPAYLLAFNPMVSQAVLFGRGRGQAV